jgi:recombination protein RecT
MQNSKSVALTQAQKNRKEALEILTKSANEIQRALPKHMTTDRFTRIVLTEVRKNPKLVEECNPYSFIGAVIQSAQLGLEIGSTLGHAYLVPFGKECTLITGYRGIVDLARRDGRVSGIHADVVYKGEHFENRVVNGRVVFNHTPNYDIRDMAKDDDIIGAYAIGSFRDGGEPQISFVPIKKILRIRNEKTANMKEWQLQKAPWIIHFEAMCKKTAVRDVGKLLPQSPEYARAMAIEEGEIKSFQPFIDEGVIEADFTTEEHEPQKIIKMQNEAGASKKEPITPGEVAAKNKEWEEAISTFNALSETYETNGGVVANLFKPTGIDPKTIPDSDIKRVLAANSMLKGAIEKGDYK